MHATAGASTPLGIHLLQILFFVLWFGVAITNLMYPRILWKITQGWRARQEPPKVFFRIRRMWSVLMILMGIGLLFSTRGL
jgi:cytochrome b561